MLVKKFSKNLEISLNLFNFAAWNYKSSTANITKLSEKRANNTLKITNYVN